MYIDIDSIHIHLKNIPAGAVQGRIEEIKERLIKEFHIAARAVRKEPHQHIHIKQLNLGTIAMTRSSDNPGNKIHTGTHSLDWHASAARTIAKGVIRRIV
jgi:hypothetical protein